jgi:hypothetical protein
MRISTGGEKWAGGGRKVVGVDHCFREPAVQNRGDS